VTGQATGPDGGAPVDRRWFEEALRSQGFVVEPPADDDEMDATIEPQEPGAVALAAPGDASGDQEPADEVPPATEVERPPVPSALLARIAARGRPAPADDDPERQPGSFAAAESPVEAARDGAPEGNGRTHPDNERAAPWASAVIAPVAPWAVDAAPLPDGPAPETHDDAGEVPAAAIPPEAVPSADASADSPATRPVAADRTPVPMSAGRQQEAFTGPHASAATSAAAITVAAEASPAVAAGTEASEGQLWALVGAPEPTAGSSAGSEATRVILTILAAFLILVIVVGSLVLATQIL
jgi:hypothetical protein